MALEITELALPLGAEVKGLDPANLHDEDLRQLRQTFDERAVLVFRDLDIDTNFQAFLSETMIGLAPGQGGDTDDARDSYISNRKDGAAAPFGRLQFHTDTMWAEEPLLVLSLYGEDVGSPVSPTSYVSTTYAWQTLPKELRARVEGLSAVHTAGQLRREGDGDDLVVSVPEHPKSTITPIGHVHPRTGKTMLYVSEQVTHEIVGVSPDESKELLEKLFDHLYKTENMYSHEWRNGDLVIWDNLAVQHGRMNVALDGPPRTLRKFCSPLENIAKEERAFKYSPAT